MNKKSQKIKRKILALPVFTRIVSFITYNLHRINLEFNKIECQHGHPVGLAQCSKKRIRLHSLSKPQVQIKRLNKKKMRIKSEFT